mgnify:CR=1 FL=1
MVRTLFLGFMIQLARISLLWFNFGLTRIIEMGFKICMACTRIVVVVFNHQLSFYRLGEGQNNSFGGLSYGPKTLSQNLQQSQIQWLPRSLTLVPPRHEDEVCVCGCSAEWKNHVAYIICDGAESGC